ncbi:MAG: 50S ribosomal protein L11 methyltransferase [Clostridia bacterium]|nr:50S ribosomal protein L11 methyltransferase [Clostridia bacterium]
MDYVEITVSTSSLGADAVSDEMLRLGAMGTQILDRADLPDPEKPVHNWELMDQSVIDNMPEDVQVKAWYSEEETPVILEKLRSFLPTLRESCHFDLGTLEISVQSVQDTDWNENWKKYYKPFRAGKHLVIKPSWETWDAQEGDLIIEMDPGMAFGTGTHETTALCVELIEDYYKGGTLLDVGTGSGILALCAAKLGAENITAVDIDPDAVRVAKENAQRNGVADKIDVREGDLIQGLDASFDFAAANILAPIVKLLLPPMYKHTVKGGLFICSGILKEQEEDVCDAIEKAGYTLLEVRRKNDWVAMAARKD